jgi:hypothetical protein
VVRVSERFLKRFLLRHAARVPLCAGLTGEHMRALESYLIPEAYAVTVQWSLRIQPEHFSDKRAVRLSANRPDQYQLVPALQCDPLSVTEVKFRRVLTVRERNRGFGVFG